MKIKITISIISIIFVFLSLFIFCIKDSTGLNPEIEDKKKYDNSNVFIAFNFGSIFYQSDNIWLMDLNGSNWKNLTNNPYEYNAKVFSPDGSKIACITPGGSQPGGLLLLDIVTGVKKIISKDISGLIEHPHFSPDGTKIVIGNKYVPPDKSIEQDIYIMDIDGSNIKNLTNDVGLNFNPSFSPDGEKIIFVSARNSKYNIETMSTDGSNRQVIFSSSVSFWHAYFFPDGSKIMFRGSNTEIFTINIDGGNLLNLTEGKYLGGAIPDISKDGDKIVTSAYRDGEEDILLMNSDGSNKVFLTSANKHNEHPKFSPDDTYIVYHAMVATNNYAIFRMDLNGENNKNLTRSNGFCVYPIIQSR